MDASTFFRSLRRMAFVLPILTLSACGPNVATGPTPGAENGSPPPVVAPVKVTSDRPTPCAPCGTPPAFEKVYTRPLPH